MEISKEQYLNELKIDSENTHNFLKAIRELELEISSLNLQLKQKNEYIEIIEQRHAEQIEIVLNSQSEWDE